MLGPGFTYRVKPINNMTTPIGLNPAFDIQLGRQFPVERGVGRAMDGGGGGRWSHDEERGKKEGGRKHTHTQRVGRKDGRGKGVCGGEGVGGSPIHVGFFLTELASWLYLLLQDRLYGAHLVVF